MKYVKLEFALILLLFLSSCSAFKPKITNSHAGKYKVGETLSKDFLDVQVAVIPITSPKSITEKQKTFFDLRDSIPHKYLEVLGGKVKTASDLIKYLKEPLSDKAKKTSSKLKTDYATQKVKFVIGNIKNYQKLGVKDKPEFFHPNTRLQTLNTTLDFSNSDFEILSIDKLESEFETIDLGTVSRSGTSNFSSKLTGQYGITNTNGNKNTGGSTGVIGADNGNIQNAYDVNGNLIGVISNNNANKNTISDGFESNKTSTKGIGANGELGFNTSESIEEALAVKLKRLKTGFVFNNKSITLSQHGSNLLDISDNIVVTATIRPKTDLKTNAVMFFSNLFNDSLFNKAKDLKLTRRSIKYMSCESRNVDVSISSEGLLRAVQNKFRGDNVLEFDDKVIYYPFKLSNKTSSKTQISNWSNCTQIYGIEYIDNSGIAYDLMAGIGNIYEAHFVSNEKDVFSSWLRLQLRNPSIVDLTHPLLEVYFIERTPFGSPPSTNIIKIIDSNLKTSDISKIKNLKFKFRLISK